MGISNNNLCSVCPDYEESLFHTYLLFGLGMLRFQENLKYLEFKLF